MIIKELYLNNTGKINGALFGVAASAIGVAALFGSNNDIAVRHKIAIIMALFLVTALTALAVTKSLEHMAEREKDQELEDNDTYYSSGFFTGVNDLDNAKPDNRSLFAKYPKTSVAAGGFIIGALSVVALQFYAEDMGFDLDKVTENKYLLGLGCATLLAIAATSLMHTIENGITHSELVDHKEQEYLAQGNRAMIGAIIGAGIAGVVMMTAMQDFDIWAQLLTAAAIITASALILTPPTSLIKNAGFCSGNGLCIIAP